MGKIILVIGGTRSGKSDFALARAEDIGGTLCFIATCPVTDEEMAARIKMHQLGRASGVWSTVEEPLAIEEVVSRDEYDLYLVDCLTLWISNLMMDCSSRAAECSEEFIEGITGRLLETVSAIRATVIFVTNEVGTGIVPDNELARRYRDLVGTCNRIIAAAADEAVLVSCGLPLYMKK
jgi:adenosylcobinamide kinase/adenosylcobinamide-phosphate guanylyltransferase